jgi:hypothetical protein
MEAAKRGHGEQRRPEEYDSDVPLDGRKLPVDAARCWGDDAH